MAATQAPLDEGLQLVVPGRAAPLGDGWTWVVRGWKLFAAAPLMWIISVVVLFVIAIVMAFVPIVGSLAFQVLQPVFAGGLVAACRSLERGGEFEIEHLFAGFSKRFGALAIVGVIFMVASLALVVAVFAFAGLSVLGAIFSGSPDAVAAALAGSALAMLLAVLVMLLFFIPLVAAYWFAPALVMMHGMSPVAAMKESFYACFRNFVTFLVYGLVMLVGAILAMIPFGLGMLVWVPLAITSTYAAYRQIFTEEAAPAAPRPAMV